MHVQRTTELVLEEANEGTNNYIQSFIDFFETVYRALDIQFPYNDSDGDGIPDSSDPFPHNEDTIDSDQDGYPDIIDQSPNDPNIH